MPDIADNNAFSSSEDISFDYSFVSNPARIAIYDDFISPPRIVTIKPSNTNKFIEDLASTIYDLASRKGGRIAYTVIREVTENFIHAQFSEIVVSIYDEGNTIRFSDQGPGINDKDRAQKPGYTSAIEPMKQFIRGVGSGLPTVKDYLSISHGHITIDDNMGKGAIVTISLVEHTSETTQQDMHIITQTINDQEREILLLFSDNNILGITDIVKLTGKAQSSISYQLGKLEEKGFIERTPSKKRRATEQGLHVANFLKRHPA